MSKFEVKTHADIDECITEARRDGRSAMSVGKKVFWIYYTKGVFDVWVKDIKSPEILDSMMILSNNTYVEVMEYLHLKL